MVPNESHQDSSIWRSAFSRCYKTKHEQAAQRLTTELQRTREYAKLLAAEIGRDLPEYTVHDSSHSDALWGSADVVCGKDYPLTPPEAFVLGVAFLVHDLAMGSAALPTFPDRSDPRWNDLLVADLSAYYGRNPTAEEIANPPLDIRNYVKSKLLRELHAEQVFRVLEESFQDSESDQGYYLISDTDLRDQYCNLIGRIAASHGWSINRLSSEFGVSIGAPATMPPDWTIDPLALACIMRIADVAQLDSRRAPGFLRAIRRPDGESRAHWIFQQRLQRPRLNRDRLVYTSMKPFPVEDSEAWWLCHDFLKQVDHELGSVDALLADSGRARFAARAVSGVDSPTRLAKYIPVQGWHPVDVQVQVANVARLVQTLGGQELYGNDPHVPLRELISNAADAVRAKKCLLNNSAFGPSEIPASVTVSIESDSDRTYLVVNDNGIGMSEQVLSDALLNFGESYWRSSRSRYDLPGLLSSGFHSTGHYGIGFFSVFMLGEMVTVASRRYDASVYETRVLDFKRGIEGRPVLREANESELLWHGGTTVRVLLQDAINQPGGLLWREGSTVIWSVKELCAWLCPTLDVDLYVYEEGARSLAIRANDWKEIDAKTLLRRLIPRFDETRIRDVSERLGDVTLDGELVGRAVIASGAAEGLFTYEEELLNAVTTVGGVRSKSYLTGTAGVFIGKSERAARDFAKPLVQKSGLAAWASKQGELLAPFLEKEDQEEAAAFVRSCTGDVGKLHIAECSQGRVSSYGVRELAQENDSLTLIHNAAWELQRRNREGARLGRKIISVNVIPPPSLRAYRAGRNYMEKQHSAWDREIESRDTWLYSIGLMGLVMELIAAEWNVSTCVLIDQMRNQDGLLSESGKGRNLETTAKFVNNELVDHKSAVWLYRPARDAPLSY